jgi:DNA uptake protein ComE-like DNA-binding protein
MRNQSPGPWVSLTRSEYAGAFFMLVLAVLLALIPAVFSTGKQDNVLYAADSAQRATLLARHLAATDSFFRKKKPKYIPWHRLKSGDLENLGLAAEDADRIYQKIKMGYRYSSLSELSRETGLDTAVLKNAVSTFSFGEKKTGKQKPVNIELNSCDTTALIALPGIGSKTALRIIRFRDALGGFYNKEQLLETRFADTAALRKLLPEMQVNTGLLKKISIQTAGIETLKKHPYISEKQAKVMLAFRQQHGKLNENLLKEIKIISPAELSRLLPYLNFNE